MPLFYEDNSERDFICSKPEHDGIRTCTDIPPYPDSSGFACDLTLAQFESLIGILLPTQSLQHICSAGPVFGRPPRVRIIPDPANENTTDPIIPHASCINETMDNVVTAIVKITSNAAKLIVEPVNVAPQVHSIIQSLAKPSFTESFHCVNWNRFFSSCNASAKNPFMGAISFDNIGFSWVAIFQVQCFLL